MYVDKIESTPKIDIKFTIISICIVLSLLGMAIYFN